MVFFSFKWPWTSSMKRPIFLSYFSFHSLFLSNHTWIYSNIHVDYPTCMCTLNLIDASRSTLIDATKTTAERLPSSSSLPQLTACCCSFVDSFNSNIHPFFDSHATSIGFPLHLRDCIWSDNRDMTIDILVPPCHRWNGRSESRRVKIVSTARYFDSIGTLATSTNRHSKPFNLQENWILQRIVKVASWCKWSAEWMDGI